MASYRRNAESNRDALFGSSPSAGGGSRSGNRTSSQTTVKMTSSNSVYTSSNIAGTNDPASSVSQRRTNTFAGALTGAAKVSKMNEAEEYRIKAKNAMTKSLFSPIDPIAGAMFYHRAAEAYKLCGENRLERLHRIASGDCQLGHRAFSSAAQEYVRAAELSEISDETQGRKRAECTKLYSDAANAWKEAGDLGRFGECMLKSAFSLLIGNSQNEDGEDEEEIIIGGRRLMSMNKDAVKAIEAAVETHVPDPLNRYKTFRQTGISAFIDPDASNESDQDEDAILELCQSHLVSTSYTNETLFEAVKRFVEYGEYKSALYAAGAVTAILEHEGFATISLSRAYCVETILALAIGDVVTADNYFLQVHLQNNNYLTSRECKLAEDLIRAVKMRDVDDLEGARNPNGENKGALANLDMNIRTVVAGLRISGAVKKSATKHTATLASAPPSTSGTAAVQANGNKDVHDELDDLMNDMGLGDNDDEDDEDLDLR